MTNTSKPRPGSISGCVIDCGKSEAAKPRKGKPAKSSPPVDTQPIADALLTLYCVDPENTPGALPEQTVCSKEDGCFEFPDLKAGPYWVRCCAFASDRIIKTAVEPGCDSHICFEVELAYSLQTLVAMKDCEALMRCDTVSAGRPVLIRAEHDNDLVCDPVEYVWSASQGALTSASYPNERYLITRFAQGLAVVTATMQNLGENKARVATSAAVSVMPPNFASGDGTDVAGFPGSTGRMRGTGLQGGTGPADGTDGRPGSPSINVTLQRSASSFTDDVGLWAAIRFHAKAISFGGLGVKGSGRGLRGYQGFIEQVLCGGDVSGIKGVREPGTTDRCGPTPNLTAQLSDPAKNLPMHGMAAYELLKTATEIFLLWNCGVAVRQNGQGLPPTIGIPNTLGIPTDALGNPLTSDNEEFGRSGQDVAKVTAGLASYLGTGRLPYIERVVETAFPDYVSIGSPGAFHNSVFCTGVLTPRADCVCLIELIWSYWHEEGMLVQSMNAISQRFQNVHGGGDRDPLAHVTIDPLRPLNNFLWSYVQDEQNRLTVKRRDAEYRHHYGLPIVGRAVPALRPADNRSKFLEGFHNLLHRCSVFYKEDSDTTVIADGFVVLQSLKEVHLLLAQGAHNQFGDLPWTARVEMLIQQWLLARPEMRDFLQSRPMVPYTEAWMPQVDTMKTLQGWSDVTVTHFHDLAAFGEQILLSVRYGDWIELNDENHAKNWARYWRPEIQSYIHAYRTVTGVDLTNPDTVDYTMPALHLRKRLALQQAR